MRLLSDLWAASPRRSAVVALLIVAGAAGGALAAPLAGTVLVHRSPAAFTALAAALAAAVLSDVVVGLIMARLTADWSADVRRRLCRVAFGQDLPTLEHTPVGELLDRIDSDVYQVASEVRGVGVRIIQLLATGLLSTATALLVWWPAGMAMLALATLLGFGLRKPTRRIAPALMREEEAWSDLAAMMEESIHGQDDVRTSTTRADCGGTGSWSTSRSCSCDPTKSATSRNCPGCCRGRSTTTSAWAMTWTPPALWPPLSWNTTWLRAAG